MKWKMFLHLFGIVLLLALFTQCGRYGKDRILPTVDDDSDRPAWAGSGDEVNPHIRGNETSGTSRGGDYGDLYKLLRDDNGVPIMIKKDLDGLEVYYVQPIAFDAFGDVIELELNDEGEVIDEDYAPIEVDFGRLNIVRSPQSVLDQALEESMKVLKGTDAVISLDFCGRLTSTYTDDLTGETIVKTIDSPRENMAIYQYIMKNLFEPFLYDEDGNVTADVNILAFLGEAPYNFDPLDIAASCFAAGSDKTGTVDIDEVVYINGFIECVGLNPILNEHDYDFSHDQNYYFNFSAPILGDAQFQYNRGKYADRYLKIMVIKSDNTWETVIKSVKEVMEGLWDGNVRFNGEWEGDLTKVEGFAAAVDDAVQVLEFVHGDSNIEFLPDYVPPTP